MLINVPKKESKKTPPRHRRDTSDFLIPERSGIAERRELKPENCHNRQNLVGVIHITRITPEGNNVSHPDRNPDLAFITPHFRSEMVT